MTDDLKHLEGFAGFTAWNLIDGDVMAGKIKGRGMTGWSVEVTRVDGTWVVVAEVKLRPATEEDVQAAIAFYTKKMITPRVANFMAQRS